MKKSVFMLGVCLCLCSLAYAADGQPDKQRMAQYQALEKQRQELLAWPHEHAGAPYWSGRKRLKQAEEIRVQQYQQFRDVKLLQLEQWQKQVKELLSKADDLPYFRPNTLPAENLAVMTEHENLLLELLKAYPDNAANMPADRLLEVLADNADMEKYLKNYQQYLAAYTHFPACVENMNEYGRRELEAYGKDYTSLFRLMTTLAEGCQRYAREQVRLQEEAKNRKALTENIQQMRKENQNNPAAFSFLWSGK